MRFEHDVRDEIEILDARPSGDEWAILRREGPLDLDGLQKPLELHLSDDGRFSAVVERFGRFGRVFSDRRKTMDLDRGDYRPETCVFPVAFVVHNGRTLLVHGTDWNRLDVSDPGTGALLTERGPTVCTDIDDVPPHYLDYFHAGLSVSPNGRWIADDGWYWHPLGELRIWSLDTWLDENVWESEDGLSIQTLTRRVYLWDVPNVWIDDDRLAFWGEGDDSDAMTDAVRLYDATLRREVQAFPGPSVSPAQSWSEDAARTGWLAYDGRLFAVSPENGTGVWDLATGELLYRDPAFAPRRYHSRHREFLSWEEGKAWTSRLVP